MRAKIYSIAIDNDDGIVAGGWAQFKEWWGAVLARYNSYGTLDTTFGDGDQAKSNSAQTLINSIAIDKQGRIVVGGYQEAQSPYTGSEKNALLARYTTKLTVDDSFGDHGQVNISFVPDSDSEITSIAIDEQERIVAGGWVRESHVGGVALRFALTRLTDDDFDPEFGEDNGKVLTKVTGDQTLHCLAIDHEGRIVAGGWATPARVVFPPLAVLLAGLAILATVGILATLGIFWAG
ncbi:MAG: hypothetical protein QNJ42_23500 [Crocosphaera sp.]|nr:hypothetical protein [Crocosphaera sp.]